MLTKYIFQSGVGAAINSGFSHRRSCPTGQERSPKSAPQHVPTVVAHFEKESAHKYCIFEPHLIL